MKPQDKNAAPDDLPTGPPGRCRSAGGGRRPPADTGPPPRHPAPGRPAPPRLPASLPERPQLPL